MALTPSPTAPSSRHHSAALTTMASPTRPSPTPSRRCSGRARGRSTRCAARSRRAGGRSEPDGLQAAPEGGEQPRHGTRPAPFGRGRAGSGLGAGALARTRRRRTSGLATGRAGSRALALRPRRGRRAGRHAATLRESHTGPTRNTRLRSTARRPLDLPEDASPEGCEEESADRGQHEQESETVDTNEEPQVAEAERGRHKAWQASSGTRCASDSPQRFAGHIGARQPWSRSSCRWSGGSAPASTATTMLTMPRVSSPRTARMAPDVLPGRGRRPSERELPGRGRPCPSCRSRAAPCAGRSARGSGPVRRAAHPLGRPA